MPPRRRGARSRARAPGLDQPLCPWTLLDLAAHLHTTDPGLAALARLADRPVTLHGYTPDLTAWTAASPEAVLAALLAATRWADPFRRRPWTAAEGIAQLAAWRGAAATNRAIHACTGMEVFKHGAIRAALAGGNGPPAIHMRGSVALRHAEASSGALAVWAATMPSDLPAKAAARGVPLIRMEDGFLRSAGLGVGLAPAASFAMDRRGIHYDPSIESDLEHLLATTDFTPDLLARAAALRAAIQATGVTKYNLAGPPPALDLPPDRPIILVPGQVEDDAAIRRGGGRIRTNAALLRAVRDARPDACILYKPHPDVEAGMRRGGRPEAGLADRVLSRVPIAPLYDQVDEVHVMSSLAGFEALLRGRKVTCWGQPFYAGWGLTEDRDPPPRRGRPLSLDALVAAALILYPRYIDPMTGLPCPPEVVVERLAAALPGGAGARRRSRLAMAVRAQVARLSRLATAWLAAH